MENAQIYIATSDYKECWGAVINEAMSSGCAVVASHAMGSVPFLIRIGENGFIYESGNIAQLTEKVKTLLLDPKLSAEFGKNAYGTIAGQWNGDIAGERLLEFMEAIISGKSVKFPDGPLSTARPLKNNWIKNN